MVTKGSTLDDVVDSMEVPVAVVDGNLDDDPILTNDNVFEDGGVEDVTIERKKHRLSPLSVDLGLPKGKQLVRTKSIEKSVIVRPDIESTTPSLMPPPAFPPLPPTPHKKSPIPKNSDDLSFSSPPPKPQRKSLSPIIRPISKGCIIEIFL